MSKHLHERGSSFQYRRVFPQDVRTTAGRRELTRSLKVRTKKEAEIEAALLDVEFNKIVASARGTGQPNEATAIVLATRLLQSKGLLTAEGAVNFPKIDPRKPEHNTIEKQLRVIKEWEEKYEAAYDQLALAVASMTPEGEVVETYDPASPHSRAFLQLTGQEAPKPDYTLHDAAVLYVETNKRKVGRKADQQAKSEQQQWLRLNALADWLGEGNRDLGYKTPFNSIDRSVAQRFKTCLVETKDWTVATRNKALEMLRAAFNVAGDEYDLAGWNNPFRKMSDAITDSKVRYPFSPNDYDLWWRSLLAWRNDNSEAALIGLMMMETGSRIYEISHLVVGDLRLDADVPHILVRNNQLRDLKGVIEHPVILFGTLPMLRGYLFSLKSEDPDDPVFPRYSKPKGNTNLSNTMNKRLRSVEGMQTERLSAYSARHAFKDRGRAARVDLAVLDYLMGHKTKQSSVVAQGYGTGYSLSVLKDAAERINAVEDWGYLDQLAN